MKNYIILVSRKWRIIIFPIKYDIARFLIISAKRVAITNARTWQMSYRNFFITYHVTHSRWNNVILKECLVKTSPTKYWLFFQSSRRIGQKCVLDRMTNIFTYWKYVKKWIGVSLNIWRKWQKMDWIKLLMWIFAWYKGSVVYTYQISICCA